MEERVDTISDGEILNSLYYAYSKKPNSWRYFSIGINEFLKDHKKEKPMGFSKVRVLQQSLNV